MRQTFPILLFVGVTVLISASNVEAQGFFGNRRSAVQLGDGLPDLPGGFTFCRLAYTSVRRFSSGNGWTTDFPEADRNLTLRLSELTPTPVSRWSHGEWGFTPVRPLDPELYQCPFLLAAHVGELGFRPEEAAAMRDYLLKGGLLWADDFWGTPSWNAFASELYKVLPEFEIVELPMDHPLFSLVYHVPRIPQIPSFNHWNRSGGQTSELGRDSEVPTMSAIQDDSGRILVLITHNTDISDGWEREAADPRYFEFFSPDAYAIGINIALWVMTN